MHRRPRPPAKASNRTGTLKIGGPLRPAEIIMEKDIRPRDWLARWGLFVTALMAGFALCLTAVLSYQSSGQLAERSGLGQAEIFLRSFRRNVPQGQASRGLLQEFINDNADFGLKYIALFEDHGLPPLEAGNPYPEFGPPSPEGRERHLERVGDRFRFSSPLPQKGLRRVPGELPSDPNKQRRMGQAGDLPPRPPPATLIMDFEPSFAHRHNWRSLLSLVSALLAGYMLILSAFIFSRMNKRALETEKNLEKQRRLASLGEMSAVLAHEIKNPLAALKGHAQLLVETLPGDGPERQKAARVVGEAVRLETLVNELLDFVRSGKLAPKPADPSSLAREAAEAVQSSRINLNLDRAPESWPLDGPKIAQALANLLRNALQASPEEDMVELTVGLEADMLSFTVRDHGPGIADEDRERVFEPFHTGRVKGVGLGLAVVKRIAEAHGGRVEVLNAEGGGALLKLLIPGEW